MELISQLGAELGAVLATLFAALPYIFGSILLILAFSVLWQAVKRFLTP
jgi:Co/Zn/Cd efflux system component